ncbi:zinc ribbon domain-containing protein [Siminovitchia sp. FSL H7-0308]|uniref:FmdB family regulatory protein n=1 Tax=Siminovitchia thermophila TaxID=1245522 RepID=A0ABS2R833_9BACI|nr:zinc ribbon domain-containing protein [Siminovitchia thermophila]MBM7715807.1 putative FmdB family regulatory protein [Siminovitchia thermophila]ONK23535.1 hypothetical protein BLX87_09940 [Bacillus sp. VT-16-64]
MPSYTFRCNDCGEFTLVFRNMEGNRGSAGCPECGMLAKRVFLPPNLYSMPQVLKTRIENGMEPRRMSRKELGPSIPRKRTPSINRPWQV